MLSCILWWALEDCLARSRLTAILHFASWALPNRKTAPASAHSRSNFKKISRYQNTQNKRDDNKCHHLFYGGR